jgi:hypothetical protein
MKKLLLEIKKSFKERPVWTAYSLLLAPLFYLFFCATALMLALIHLNISEAKRFWDENS